MKEKRIENILSDFCRFLMEQVTVLKYGREVYERCKDFFELAKRCLQKRQSVVQAAGY